MGKEEIYFVLPEEGGQAAGCELEADAEGDDVLDDVLDDLPDAEGDDILVGGDGQEQQPHGPGEEVAGSPSVLLVLSVRRRVSGADVHLVVSVQQGSRKVGTCSQPI